MTSTVLNLNDVQAARKLWDEADAVLLGVGAGASASGGLNYADPALFERWYPEYKARGFDSILEVMSRYWWLHMNKPEEYWAFWGRHIQHIRYEPGALDPYRLLRALVGDKEYFIISTNVDGQLEKAGFSKERIFAPQGDYGLFQCIKPCSQELYDNREMIERMVANMPGKHAALIRSQDVPICPKCGSLLVPNLRCDNTFVESPHLAKKPDYSKFIEENAENRLVLLELGVGYNTPIIIRYPFENIVHKYAQATLIRLNLDEADVPNKIKDKSIVLPADIKESLKALLEI